MIEYERKFQAAMNELVQAGISQNNAQPPYTRLMRKIGLKPRPPYYYSFAKVFIGQGIFFSCFWGILMWFVSWRYNPDMTITLAVTAAILAGTIFGVTMALLYARARKRHSLSDWKDF